MAQPVQIFTFFILCTNIGGILGYNTCPVANYVQQHVCEQCSTREEAITFAKRAWLSGGKACLIHVFEGSSDAKEYREEKGQCVLKKPVGGWICSNVSSTDADCIPVKNCLPAHDQRVEKQGRMYSAGVSCKPVLPLKASRDIEKCTRTCLASTSTSRALCQVSVSVAASSLCLAKGWFTLGFPCAGDIGRASTFSEGCASVNNLALDGCDTLCWAVVTKNVTAGQTDYNKLLNDHICLLKETFENYRWLDAVTFQGRVVEDQKDILNTLDRMQDQNLEREIQHRLRLGSELLSEVREHRQRYDRIRYSTEGLLAINSNSDYFMQKALQDDNLYKTLEELYQHLSGTESKSIYEKQSSFCTLQIFSLMNSYLVEGYLMWTIALELGDMEGPLPKLTVYLDDHLNEYIKRCGCPPKGSSPYVVNSNTSIQTLIDSIDSMIDISAPDMLVSLLPFIMSNDSFTDISIVMRALAGAIQANPGDKQALLKKLTVLKTQIEENSLKVCTEMNTTTLFSCEKHSHCKLYKGECWCHNQYSDREQREACGYKSGYAEKYYSIVSSGAPHDLILAMGLTPHATYCSSNSYCGYDCATNVCFVNGCYGTRLSCWNDHDRWARKFQGIVRCRNYEPFQ